MKTFKSILLFNRAVALLSERNFTPEDFAVFHPGGALGKKLYLKVDDLLANNQKPEVNLNTKITEVILTISSNRLGATAVIDDGILVGIITDGDLRRMMQENQHFDKLIAKDIMKLNPKTVEKDTMAVEALQLMKEYNISQLIVVDNNKFLGFVHLHDLLREGIL